MNLFCFPYAGGHAQSCVGLRRALLDSRIKVHLLELPGRGHRTKESFVSSMDEAIEDYLRQVSCSFDEPFAFFGHSMGAMVAHLLTLRLIDESLPIPMHLFLAGSAAPGQTDRCSPKYLLSDDEFSQYLVSLGGLPREILDDKELVAFLSAVVRADFRVLEASDEREREAHRVPIAAFAGTDDAGISLQKVRAWEGSTRGRFSFHSFTGGHFFIQSHWQEIAKIVQSRLLHVPAWGSSTKEYV